MGLLLMAFDETISLTHTFAVTPPSILAGIAPVSLWGIGTRDGALAYFLQGLTAPENAISASFLYTALIYWFLGLIGSPALFFAKKTTLGTFQNSGYRPPTHQGTFHHTCHKKVLDPPPALYLVIFLQFYYPIMQEQ